MQVIYLHSFTTSSGTFRSASTNKGVVVISLPNSSAGHVESVIEANFRDYEIRHGGRMNQKLEKELKKFFEGKLKTFTVPIDVVGKEFTQKVLRRVATIPYGETMSYGDVAHAIGHPRAHRAVGNVMRGNNLPLVVPCHRVTAANGLGGYGGGEAFKEDLLRMEGAMWPGRRK